MTIVPKDPIVRSIDYSILRDQTATCCLCFLYPGRRECYAKSQENSVREVALHDL